MYSSETYAPVWTWNIVGWLPISLLDVSGGGMNCVSCDIYACTTFGWFVFFPWGIPHCRVTGACPVTTDLIMRVSVRTTTNNSNNNNNNNNNNVGRSFRLMKAVLLFYMRDLIIFSLQWWFWHTWGVHWQFSVVIYTLRGEFWPRSKLLLLYFSSICMVHGLWVDSFVGVIGTCSTYNMWVYFRYILRSTTVILFCLSPL